MGILYVEDNRGLRENVGALLGKFFPGLWTAESGEDAYELFLEHSPGIVLTDVNLPGMSGFELARKITADQSGTRIIILSAYDEKEHLHEAINIGVFRYLAKPAKVPLLLQALDDAVSSIRDEQNKCLFESQLKDIFNYQNNLLVMLENEEPVLVNRQFLDFFGSKNLEEFMNREIDLDTLLLEHKGFLYSTEQERWLDQAIANPGKLFHTKILNHAGETRHLILKLRPIPNKEGYTILSLDDVTDLNLLGIFDSNAAKSDRNAQDRSAVIKLMQVVKDNSGEVKIHNLYRGLTIVAKGVLVNINEDEIVLKTTYSQLKAVKLVKNMTISSDLFPCSVWCKTVKAIDFDEQTVTFSDSRFVDESADQRAFIRLEPDENRHSVTLFYREIKFFGQSRIVDISIRSVKVEIDALPAGLGIDETVKLAIVLETDGQPLSFPVEGKVYRLDTLPKSFHLVVLFELLPAQADKLRGYLSKRQLELIREFKAL